MSFPRLYAAASLKQRSEPPLVNEPERFPRLYAAASLKRGGREWQHRNSHAVFRGFMPRPH